MCKKLIVVLTMSFCLISSAGADTVIWDFENGNDHGFTLWSVVPPIPAPDDPQKAGDEALTGGLPQAGVAWCIGTPHEFDGQEAVPNGGILNWGGKYSSMVGKGTLNTYALNQHGDSVHYESNDQIATSPFVLLGSGAVLTAVSGGGGGHDPVLEANPADGYTDNSGGIAVRSAATGEILATTGLGGGGTLTEFTIDLSAFAGQKVFIDVVDAHVGSYGWTIVDEIIITNAIDLGLVPEGEATAPQPDDEAPDVPRDILLSWTPGEYPMMTHNVYFSSGLDANDLHSTDIEDMWATAEGQALPAWIQYEFDKTYQLHEMLVWNYNGQSFLAGLGLKDIKVEYSTDGATWTRIDSVSVFNKATGKDDYAANTIVPFGDVPVKYVKITVNSNWGGDAFPQYGLSEVRFMYIPTDARKPDPEDGATDISIDVILGWVTGRDAVEHNVYISDDEQSVIDGTVPAVTVSEASYGPLSLDLVSVYYWRVDEVNNANAVAVWEGSTWSFTTGEYLVVDDFESYNDIEEGDESNLVYATWSDGGYGEFNDPANGSTIGYLSAPSMETTIVHSGRQSVPVMYDNTAANKSEVTVNTADLAIGTDWTVGSPESLVLWVYGDPNNSVTEQMYVKVNGAKAIYDGDLTQTEWQEFSVDLASLGIDLTNVTELTIGFEKTGATGGSGMVFIDDIWLYAPLNDQTLLEQ